MRDTGINIDLKALAQSLKDNVGKLGGFSPDQLRQAATSQSGLRRSILAALADGPKTGHQVILAIKQESKFGISPAAGSVYPLLENLVDQELASSAVEKDRKVYSITDAGSDFLTAEPSHDTSENPDSNWPLPKWVDLKGEIPRASARLAAVALDVAKNGNREQQKKAAEIIDEARRQINQLLSEI